MNKLPPLQLEGEGLQSFTAEGLDRNAVLVSGSAPSGPQNKGCLRTGPHYCPLADFSPRSGGSYFWISLCFES